MNKCKLLIIILLLSCILLPAAAQDKQAQIGELVNKYYEYGLINGTILAAENGNIIYEKGVGTADADKNLPNTTETKFRLASVTKQFTAALIMQLVEQGKLKLTDKLSDVLPYYRKDTGGKITIHHLLSHTSGIPNYTDVNQYMMSSELTKFYETKDFVQKFTGGDLQFEPGSKYAYSNSGYYILGAVIEELTGKPWSRVLKENILEPLGMTNSGVEKGVMTVENYSKGYNMTPDGLIRAQEMEMSNAGAAGAMYSTVEDMLKWDRALYTNKILSDESRKLIFTPNLNNYGYGWSIIEGKQGDKTTKVVLHTGGIFGYSTVILRMTEDDKTVIVLNNIANAHTTQLANSIAMILYGITPPPPKKQLADIFMKILKDKGVDDALKQFRELKDDKENYEYNEAEINTIGYMLINQDKTEDAIKIFELNTELYPESFNTWDSLGESWMIKGDKDKAIKFYKKSLEINPDNPSGKDALKKLEEK